MYSINATFVTSCNTTNVRSLDVIVPRPSTNINAKRISITGIYFAFFLGGGGGIEMTDWMNLLCWYIFIINPMRSCIERTTLHGVESYLYFLRSETREKKNRQYIYIVEHIKFIYTSFDEFFLPVSQRVEMNYIFSALISL